MTARKRPTSAIFLLLAIFLVPMILSWILFSEHVTLGKSTNHGQLIAPPFPFSTLNARDDLNQSAQTQIAHHWVLMLLNTNVCDQNCQKLLYNIRQIHTATGKNMMRVQRVLLTLPNSHQTENQLHQLINSQYPGTIHFTIAPDQLQKSLASYGATQGTIFIVDPLGNVMMTYHPGSNPSGIYKDIQRLLKVSQIG